MRTISEQKGKKSVSENHKDHASKARKRARARKGYIRRKKKKKRETRGGGFKKDQGPEQDSGSWILGHLKHQKKKSVCVGNI